MNDVRLILGDCLSVLPTLESGSVDAVVCDPPYPMIARPYGRWTEAEWFALMDRVVPECRRVLKPAGSAVFILQPNSERAGKMRTWLWDFLAQWGREWGVVQDAYWWNTSAMPLGGACKAGLMRPSVRLAAWLGPENCYRDQQSCLLTESDDNRAARATERFRFYPCPSRKRSETEGPMDKPRRMRAGAGERGGVTPYNVIPFGSDGRWSGGADGHPASTPLYVCRWWVRYLCPPGGVVLDPFMGSGTTAIAATREGRRAVGIERVPEYHAIAERRVAEARGPLFAGATA